MTEQSKIQNRKWTGTVALTVTFAVCGPMAQAQQQGKMLKIGWLSPGSAASISRVELFQREFRKLGYVEGKNVTFERRSAHDQLTRLADLADELARVKVDVLLTPGGNGALALKKATGTIPIVFIGAVSDPVADGLVDSLARPGGNITGFTTVAVDLTGKRLELLKQTVPKLDHVAVLWDPKSSGGARAWNDSQLSARELGLQLHSMEVSSADQYEGAFKEAIKTRSSALAVTQHTLASSNLKLITDLATKNRLASMYFRGDFVEGGGLMSYAADQGEPYRRAASMVDKILKGAKPADLPVEQPTKFELVINLKTAKQLGLTIPPNVLARADRVIK
jgi:putative tryptophan/tyrosine transport system substrate-binding protein